MAKILHQTGLFRVTLLNIFIGILKRPTLVAMVTKLWEF